VSLTFLLRRSHPKMRRNGTEIDLISARQPDGTADPCTKRVPRYSRQTPSGPGGFTKQDRRNRMDENKTSSAPAFLLNSKWDNLHTCALICSAVGGLILSHYCRRCQNSPIVHMAAR
ncbi:hypothetical protein KUCAC02_008553, partial [Chaenocephalus aceratus]